MAWKVQGLLSHLPLRGILHLKALHHMDGCIRIGVRK